MPTRFAIVVSLLLLAFVVSAVLAATVLQAQSGGDYDLEWTSAGAASVATGGAYELNSFVGQPEAGAASGGVYELDGGIGAPPDATESRSNLYLPVLIRSGG